MLRVRASDACADEWKVSGSPRIGLFSGNVRGFVVFSLERREVKRVIGNVSAASVGPAHSIHVEFV